MKYTVYFPESETYYVHYKNDLITTKNIYYSKLYSSYSRAENIMIDLREKIEEDMYIVCLNDDGEIIRPDDD